MQDGSAQIRVDIRVPVGVPIPELVEFVKRCEDAGFYGVGIHDHHHSGRDAYVALALAASSTGRIRLYPATSNTVTRHPLVLAALANSLKRLPQEGPFSLLRRGSSRSNPPANAGRLSRSYGRTRRPFVGCWLPKPCTPTGSPCVCA